MHYTSTYLYKDIFLHAEGKRYILCDKRRAS